MAVYDRWHKDPDEGDLPCSCSRGKRKLYPSGEHLKGKRWQVQWEDPNAPGRKRLKRNFAMKEGENPNVHADAFDKLIQGQLVSRSYTDPRAGEISFRDYAEGWRKSRRMPNPQTAAKIEQALRLHVYEDPGRPGGGLTPSGAPSIGQHEVATLSTRPSIVAGWAASIPLAPGPARKVLGLVSRIFRAAVADGAARRDPTRLEIVDWPGAPEQTARAWSLAQLEAMRAELPGRWRAMLDLGAGTGMRQGEMLGLGVDDVDWLKRDDPRVRVVRQLQHIGGRAVLRPVKNRKEHFPPLTSVVRDRLAAHLQAYPPLTVTLPWYDPGDRERHGQLHTVRLVFSSPVGKPAWGTTLGSTWTAAAKRAKVTPPGGRLRDDGCHALRHTAASTWLRARIDVVRVAAWLGDTVEMVTHTYAHLLPDDDDSDGRAAVEAFFRGPDSPSADGAGARDVPGGESI